MLSTAKSAGQRLILAGSAIIFPPTSPATDLRTKFFL